MSSTLYMNADIPKQQREIRCSVVKKEFFNISTLNPLESRYRAFVSCTLDTDFLGKCLELFSGQYLSWKVHCLLTQKV